MKREKSSEMRLTCNSAFVTLLHDTDVDMDATLKKLVKKLDELQVQRMRIAREIDAINTALKSLGLKPKPMNMDAHEALYVQQKPFTGTTLPEACKMVLKDYRDRWLTKGQIEWLVVRGGYNFAAKDSVNSIHVTLQRLATEGSILSERVKGSRGNKYRFADEYTKLDQQ